MSTSYWMSGSPFTLAESTTVAAGKVTLTKAASSGMRHVLHAIVAKSDLAGSTVVVKSGATTLATFEVGAAERVLTIPGGIVGNAGEAMTVELTATTVARVAAAGTTRV